jgi:hypothetical protein
MELVLATPTTLTILRPSVRLAISVVLLVEEMPLPACLVLPPVYSVELPVDVGMASTSRIRETVPAAMSRARRVMEEETTTAYCVTPPTIGPLMATTSVHVMKGTSTQEWICAKAAITRARSVGDLPQLTVSLVMPPIRD